MSLNKYKIGELIEKVDEKNHYGIRDFYGINIDKEFMPTVANTTNLDERKYKLIRKNRFVFSGMQTGRDESIRIAMYTEVEPIIVSPAYTTFEVIREDVILPTYLFMIFQSSEKDRLGWFLSDTSVRANLDWEVFCGIELNLPPISIQKKYVDVYNALLYNQKAYQSGLNEIKSTANLYIETIKNEEESKKIGPYIKLSSEKNTKLDYGIDRVRGISIEKKFITTKADMSGVNLKNYSIVNQRSFAYVTVTSRNGDKISLAFNDGDSPYICSSSYVVFEVDESTIYPEYLRILFSQSDFDRYARFHSWGSARETFGWEDMMNVSIPIPELNIQKAVADIYEVYLNRKNINEKLKTRIKNLCPILVRGAIYEASTVKGE